jgi:outer membrane receptor protein involved in Fe transport
MKITLNAVLTLMFPLSLFSQKISVSGTVFNETTKESLVQATVKIGDKATVTDIDGKYKIDLDKTGDYKVLVSFIGFNNLEKNVQITEGGVTGLDFYLFEGNTLLNTTTVTAGKFEKPLGEVTVSMDVLKPQLLENVNTRRLDDVLQKVPGVNIIDGQANIRGGSGWSYGAGSRVLLLVDDIPALQADAGFPNWTDIAVENIEQVEIVKGAASALYGSSAMNGIINVRTGFAKSEPETRFSTQYTGFLAPKDKAKKWWTKTPYNASASINHKQKFGKLDFVGTVFYYNDDTYNKDWYNKYGRFTTGLRYRITDKFSIGLNANINTGNSQSFFYWANDSDKAYVGSSSAYTTTNSKTRFNIDPYINYYDNYGNRHKVMTRLYSIKNKLSNNQSNGSDLYYGEYQFQRQFEKLVVTAGLVGIKTAVNSELYSDTAFRSNNLSAYVQSDFKLGKLNLSAGFRVERNNIQGPKLAKYRITDAPFATPNNGETTEAKPVFRVGANYQVGKATFLRSSWGQGYRFPTVAEMYISTLVGGLPIVPNPYLTSETGWTAEIAVKQGFKIGGLQGFADVALFQSEYTNMMEFQASKLGFLAFQSQNSGDTRIKGIETSIAATGKLGEITPSFLIGYTYIDPKYRDFTPAAKLSSTADTVNVLKYRIKHNVKFDAQVDYKKVALGASFQYNSYMTAIDKLLEFITKSKNYRSINNKGFKILDIRASFEPIEKLKFTFIAANILNEEYSFRPGILDAPRNVSLRLDWRIK